MNGKQIMIVVGALVASALIVWFDLPLEFPGLITKVIMLFVKLSVVLALTIFAYIFAGGKKTDGL